MQNAMGFCLLVSGLGMKPTAASLVGMPAVGDIILHPGDQNLPRNHGDNPNMLGTVNFVIVTI